MCPDVDISFSGRSNIFWLKDEKSWQGGVAAVTVTADALLFSEQLNL